MDAAMIGKIEKAMQYAKESDRIQFNAFDAVFKGDHSEHNVSYKEGEWTCDCSFYQARGVCSHIMTFERILTDAVEPAQATPMPA